MTWPSLARRWLAAALASLIALLLVAVGVVGVAADEPATGDDEDPEEVTVDEPTVSLSVVIGDLVGSSWRPLGLVTSKIQGSTVTGSSASSEEVDPDAAAEAERSLEDLGAERTPDGLVVTLPETVLFDFDSAELLGDADDTIERVAEVLLYYDDVEIEVQGHTDSRGEDDYNQRLSEERADAVLDALAAAGVPTGRMAAEGFGPREPVAPNTTSDGEDDPEGRQQNRRVEILLREE